MRQTSEPDSEWVNRGRRINKWKKPYIQRSKEPRACEYETAREPPNLVPYTSTNKRASSLRDLNIILL